MTENFIAIDWGSTHLRAWHFSQGICVDSRQQEAGITRLAGRHPREILNAITDGWQTSSTPVVMAGMIGSQQGWQNVPYLPCPIMLDDLGRQLYPVDDATWIVPGVNIADERGVNIMRGEETQLAGAWQLAPASLYILPGTHCKWAEVDNGCLTRFKTVMTGELHHLLMTHSLIGNTLPPQIANREAFIHGLECGLQDGEILARLFETRAAWVLGKLAQDAVSERLSGLLIGAEVAQMTRLYASFAERRIVIVGGEQLALRYQTALELLGIQADIISGETAFLQGIRSMINERVI